ncbi:Stk1 family PASTA domain-containing Ser/Thr kinase [Schaalia suimastitidis]|uniref:Stk1 family PASTA domain-containing Ser/Thr kinase n=1 Tax=Schaalia suimastitidis TaxID=121163 RepID=UPI0004109668|nr:Stk1 family PASTA domain-containing Ser/Thr kinase [Schaalia suimastitidis]
MAEPVVRQLGGRYEVRSLIGRGGMAEVYLGFDARLSRVVAIKILREELARDSVFQARFRREAQSAASLNHPNIVAVYDTGEESVIGADGRNLALPYIVMEYVEGHTVKDLLSDGTPVPIDEAVDITSGVLSALEYSHSKDLVHRDIKPGNIMLTTQGKVKVMDFGIARALTDSQSTMTQTNAVVGTAQYLSPEQARGEQVDPRSDLYSTGVVLFELLTGQPPFKGDSAVAVAYQHVQQIPPTPSSIASDVPEPLDRIVLKAMAKNPADRYPTASSMKADLIRLTSGAQVNAPAAAVWTAASAGAAATTVTEAISAPPMPAATMTRLADGTQVMASVPPPADNESTRKKVPWGWIGAALVVAALVIFGIYALLNNNTTQTETKPVPDVTNMTQEAAKAAIESAGFVWKLGESEPSDTIAENSVVRTDPPATTELAVGSEVTAYLSSGKESVDIPADLVGMTPEEAKAAVEALGLVWEVSDEQVASEEVEAGKIAKTNPSPGKKVKTGSTVTGYVSSGSEQVAVPDLSGMTQDQARQALTAAGLTVGNVTVANSADVAEGRVISSTPAANEMLRKGESVALVLSDGKVTIPTGILNSTIDDAAAKLQALGLEVYKTEVYSSTAAAGTVVGMSEREGAVVAQRSRITLEVSLGADPGTSGNANTNAP